MINIKYNPEISLGTIVEVVSLLMIVGGGYAAITNTETRHEAQLIQHDKDITRIERQYQDLNIEIKTDIKELGRGMAALDNKISASIIEQVKNDRDARKLR